MGQYKVPQNVEAEDKIIGALTLKQFIYTVIGVMIGVVSFFALRKAPIVMLIVGLPPTALFLMLGLYQRQDQPFEALFLSLVSFTAKPRKRLWEKEPIEEVFKIEAPKVVKTVTQRDPQEVRGQLEHLSQVVDSRGWGGKSAALQEPTGEQELIEEGRLFMPQEAQGAEEPEISAADDILDFQNNPSAHNLGAMIQDRSQAIRDDAVKKLQADVKAEAEPQHRTGGGITHVGSSELTSEAMAIPAGTVVNPTAGSGSPGAAAGEQSNDNQTTSEMTTNPLDGILKLAMESDDLPVSQVAAQANRQPNLAPGQSVSLRNNGNSSE